MELLWKAAALRPAVSVRLPEEAVLPLQVVAMPVRPLEEAVLLLQVVAMPARSSWGAPLWQVAAFPPSSVAAMATTTAARS